MEKENKRVKILKENITAIIWKYPLELNQSYDTIKKTIENHEANINEFNEFLANNEDLESLSIQAQGKAVLLGWRNLTSVSIKNNLIKMSIVYFFCLFEHFIKDCFKMLYLYEPSMLKSNRTFTYETILNLRDFNNIINSMIEEELEKIGRMNIDKIKDRIALKIGIDCEKDFHSWDFLREQYYRRNVIVHNFGKISKAYCEIMKIDITRLNESLDIDFDYYKKCFFTINNFISFFVDALQMKFIGKILTINDMIDNGMENVPIGK